MSENGSTNGDEMVDVHLGRIVIKDDQSHQFIYLADQNAGRGFPIVIGNNEADEIYRVVHSDAPPRPLTHQLCYSAIQALGAEIMRIDIVDLRENTFYAQLVLQNESGDVTAVIDARPSDAIALALRAGCPLRVAKHVMDQACADSN